MILQKCNETGLAMYGAPSDKVKSIKVFEENGSVQLWVEFSSGQEAFQYLSADEAAALSLVLERLSVRCLKAKANSIMDGLE